jgi:putative ABC transport system permease protein
MLDHLAADVRYALRKLRRAPGFSAIAILTLAVGIAAVTTIFSFANDVYFRPLPYRDSERLVAVDEEGLKNYYTFSAVSPQSVTQLLHPSRAFERVAVYKQDGSRLLFGTEPQSVRVLRVDTSFSRLFQLRPQIGRLFTIEEIIGDASVTAISDNLWRTRYGADSSVLGKVLMMFDRSYTVVGVMPPAFRFPYQTDLWLPLPKQVLAMDAEDNEVSVAAKLRKNVPRSTALAELTVIALRVKDTDPVRLRRLRLVLRDEVLERRGYQFLPVPSLFFGAAFLVLVVACSNVANLFLARAAERRAEMAVRGAMGAGRGRLIRQLLTEGFVLGILAVLVGTVLAVWCIKVALSLIPTYGFPSWLSFELDGRVLVFSVAVALLVTLLVGLTPATEGTRFDLVRALKVGGDGGSAKAGIGRSARRGLVIQLAVAVVLFVGAALLVRSYGRLMTVDLGFPAGRIAKVSLYFDGTHYPTSEPQMRLAEGVYPQVAALPAAKVVAIRGVYMGDREPASSGPDLRSARAKSQQPAREDYRLFADGDTSTVRAFGATQFYPRLLAVSDNYFAMTNQRMLRGRALSPEDAFGGARVVVVSQSFARRLWQDGDPLGHTLQKGARGEPYTVVGLVNDVRDLRGGSRGMKAELQSDAYFSTRQASAANLDILARTDADIASLRSAIIALVRSTDPTIIVSPRETTMASGIEANLFATRIFGSLIAGFALTALLLAIVGVYGLVAYGVTQRTREIGIRIALGGTAEKVVAMIMREGLRFVLVGVAIGLVIAAGTTRLLKWLLFDVSPLDPIAYVAAAVMFGAVALLACYLPARRASRVDAMIALRSE